MTITPGTKCQARIGKPRKWVAAIYRSTSPGGTIIFVEIQNNGQPVEVGLPKGDVHFGDSQ